MIREENTILKDKLKSIESHGGDVKGLDFSSLPAPRGSDKASDTELKVRQGFFFFFLLACLLHVWR